MKRNLLLDAIKGVGSPPARGRGLKRQKQPKQATLLGRPPHGGVD